MNLFKVGNAELEALYHAQVRPVGSSNRLARCPLGPGLSGGGGSESAARSGGGRGGAGQSGRNARGVDDPAKLCAARVNGGGASQGVRAPLRRRLMRAWCGAAGRADGLHVADDCVPDRLLPELDHAAVRARLVQDATRDASLREFGASGVRSGRSCMPAWIEGVSSSLCMGVSLFGMHAIELPDLEAVH
eukprot:31089-Chlamydomonas_euryale.AAC.3